MRQAWRWFGPKAGVTLDNVRQAGATDVVSALHEVPIGQAWTEKQVHERKSLIETTPAGRITLTWSVVESIPIPDAVKRLGGAAKHEIADRDNQPRIFGYRNKFRGRHIPEFRVVPA